MPDRQLAVYHPRPGDRFAEVFRTALPWSYWEPDVAAETLFWVLRAAEPADVAGLRDDERRLNAALRRRVGRPLVVGDAVAVGGCVFVCGPYGRAVPVTLDGPAGTPFVPSAPDAPKRCPGSPQAGDHPHPGTRLPLNPYRPSQGRNRQEVNR
ncbi:hypothetical protein GCM10017673_40330 [Streptosporangium violaceochromogenes]|nr:hypothetical protein GCM10017673_40330 [Streptosporangium violaceochromogenes]